MLSLTLSAPAGWAQSGAPVNSDLNASLMYELLVSEMSAANGDASSAYQFMLDAAQKSRSDQLFERAVEIALRARVGDSALQAAQAWSRANPASQDATRYLLQILIGLNKLPETVEPVKRDLARLPSKERAAAISLVPRYYLRSTDKKLAVKVVEQALAPELGNPTTGPAAYAAIGTMRLLASDAEGALDAAKKGAALNTRAEEPVQLALALIDPRLPAAEALVQAHLKAGARPEMHMAYVRKLLDATRYDEAAAEVLQLNASAPDFAEAWLVRGSLALQDKKPEQAKTALDTFVNLRLDANRRNQTEAENDRALTQAYLLLADLAEQNHQPDEALRMLALVETPQDALRVQVRRAAIVAHQGKLEEARALIRSAPESLPEDARTKISAEAQLLRDNKQFQEVYVFLQDAVRRNPDDVDLRYDMAMAAEKLDKVDEMEKLLRQVIAEKPDYQHAYNALGYSLADRKLRLPEARELIKKALAFSPDDPFILDSLGWVEFRSGNLDQALQILEGAFHNRQDAEIAAHLGEVLWSLGRQDQARGVWKDGLAQNPDNDTLLDTIKRLSPP
jgi:tetratricopeptide (TPR) repeat protein